MLDWSKVAPLKEPTRKQVALYRRWVTYLRDSKLTEDEVQRRAKYFTEMNEKVPNA